MFDKSLFRKKGFVIFYRNFAFSQFNVFEKLILGPKKAFPKNYYLSKRNKFATFFSILRKILLQRTAKFFQLNGEKGVFTTIFIIFRRIFFSKIIQFSSRRFFLCPEIAHDAQTLL